jgi:hypothetical protein
MDTSFTLEKTPTYHSSGMGARSGATNSRRAATESSLSRL